MKRAAVYRVLYGEDFIKQSIESVIGAVDEVYVFWTNKVWGDCTAVKYQGEIIQFPDKFDNAVDVIKSIGSPKIRLIEHYKPTPHNQWTILANRYVDADIVLIMEHDQIMDDAKMAFEEFEDSEWKTAATQQTEYWKSSRYSIPQRRRPGPIFWRSPLFETRLTGRNSTKTHKLAATAKNMGFCVSDRSMYWKHLTALAFSKKISDTPPRHDWYSEIWLKWTPEMQNLGISEGMSKQIKHAYRAGYDEDYFENGIASGKSLYTNYRWIPELTIPMCCDLKALLGLDGKVLDYGCAKGYMVKALRLLGVDAYGYDISEYAINKAPHETAQYLHNTLPDNKFNWVIAKDVLEHIDYAFLHNALQNINCKNLFVAVPLGKNGKYNVPDYDVDTTHNIAESLDWWVDRLGDAGFKVTYKGYSFGRLKQNWASYPNGNGFLIGEK